MSRRIRWYIVVINLSLPSPSTGMIKTSTLFLNFNFLNIRMLVQTRRVFAETVTYIIMYYYKTKNLLAKIIT